MDQLKSLGKFAKKSKPFMGGLLLGTVGLKALTSKDAKRLYSNVIAKGMEIRDGIEASIDEAKQEGEDVLADAKVIYEKNKQAEAEDLLAAEGEDEADTATETN